uniref:NaTx n=1 Tax=Strongyloides stercoralis TaxID=6248 RepID=A0A0K0EB13_STRER
MKLFLFFICLITTVQCGLMDIFNKQQRGNVGVCYLKGCIKYCKNERGMKDGYCDIISNHDGYKRYTCVCLNSDHIDDSVTEDQVYISE